MAGADLQRFVGRWEVAVDVPGADSTGLVVFEWLGSLLVQRTEIPDPRVPNSICVVAVQDSGGYLQHYFDSRGVVRLYEMTFDGADWTLVRTEPDFSPLSFHQRYIGRFNPDANTIEGEWQTSDDGRQWRRDFGIVHRRLTT